MTFGTFPTRAKAAKKIKSKARVKIVNEDDDESDYDQDEIHASDDLAYELDDARIVIAQSSVELRDVDIMYKHSTPIQQSKFRLDDWLRWQMINTRPERLYTDADLADAATLERGLRLVYLRRLGRSIMTLCSKGCRPEPDESEEETDGERTDPEADEAEDDRVPPFDPHKDHGGDPATPVPTSSQSSLPEVPTSPIAVPPVDDKKRQAGPQRGRASKTARQELAARPSTLQVYKTALIAAGVTIPRSTKRKQEFVELYDANLYKMEIDEDDEDEEELADDENDGDDETEDEPDVENMSVCDDDGIPHQYSSTDFSTKHITEEDSDFKAQIEAGMDGIQSKDEEMAPRPLGHLGGLGDSGSGD